MFTMTLFNEHYATQKNSIISQVDDSMFNFSELPGVNPDAGDAWRCQENTLYKSSKWRNFDLTFQNTKTYKNHGAFLDLLRIGVEQGLNQWNMYTPNHPVDFKKKGKTMENNFKSLESIKEIQKKFSKQTSETGNGERVFPNYVQISNYYFDVNGFGYNKTVRLQHILTPRTGQKQQAFELWPASKGNFVTHLPFANGMGLQASHYQPAASTRGYGPAWTLARLAAPQQTLARLAAPALHMKAISLTCGYLYHCYTTFVGYSWFYLLFGFIWIEWCICHSNICIL